MEAAVIVEKVFHLFAGFPDFLDDAPGPRDPPPLRRLEKAAKLVPFP